MISVAGELISPINALKIRARWEEPLGLLMPLSLTYDHDRYRFIDMKLELSLVEWEYQHSLLWYSPLKPLHDIMCLTIENLMKSISLMPYPSIKAGMSTCLESFFQLKMEGTWYTVEWIELEFLNWCRVLTVFYQDEYG